MNKKTTTDTNNLIHSSQSTEKKARETAKYLAVNKYIEGSGQNFIEYKEELNFWVERDILDLLLIQLASQTVGKRGQHLKK